MQWPLPCKDQYRIYLPMPNSKPDHPSSYQQTTSRPPAFVQWPLPYNNLYRTYLPMINSKPSPDQPASYKDQYSTNLPMPNRKPRPDHSGTYDGQCRTTNSTVSISRRPAATDVLTTRFGATLFTVEQSAQNLSPDAEQHTTSRPPGFVHWLLL